MCTSTARIPPLLPDHTRLNIVLTSTIAADDTASDNGVVTDKPATADNKRSYIKISNSQGLDIWVTQPTDQLEVHNCKDGKLAIGGKQIKTIVKASENLHTEDCGRCNTIELNQTSNVQCKLRGEGTCFKGIKCEDLSTSVSSGRISHIEPVDIVSKNSCPNAEEIIDDGEGIFSFGINNKVEINRGIGVTIIRDELGVENICSWLERPEIVIHPPHRKSPATPLKYRQYRQGMAAQTASQLLLLSCVFVVNKICPKFEFEYNFRTNES